MEFEMLIFNKPQTELARPPGKLWKYMGYIKKLNSGYILLGSKNVHIEGNKTGRRTQ